MQYRPMEITVISAKGLKRVKHMSKMDVYVVVSLVGGPAIEQKTPVDKGSGPNPNWNFPMNFNIDEVEAKKGRLSLSFKVMCHRRVHSDKDIGEANVPAKELLDNGGDGKFVKYVTYQLRKPNGKHRGELNLSYKFSNQVLETSSSVKLNEPAVATAYPPAGYPTPGQYFPPPPPAGFGFNVGQPGFQTVHSQPVGYIPVYGNGPALGMGFAPVPQQRSDNSEEVEAAFLSGVLGGLMIGDMLGNAPPGDLDGGPNCDNAAGYQYVAGDGGVHGGPQVGGGVYY